MEVYFGKVDLEVYDNVEEDSLFQHGDSYFWYKAVIDEDQVCFYDTCGRHFPIGLEQASEADTVMFAAKEIYNADQECERVKSRARSKLEQLFEFWEKH